MDIIITPNLLDDLKNKKKKVIKEFCKYIFGFIISLTFIFFIKEKPIICDIFLYIISGIYLNNCISIIGNNKLLFSKQKINKLKQIIKLIKEYKIQVFKIFNLDKHKTVLVMSEKLSLDINQLLIEFDYDYYGKKYQVNDCNFSGIKYNLKDPTLKEFLIHDSMNFETYISNINNSNYLITDCVISKIPVDIENLQTLINELKIVEEYQNIK